MPEPLTDAQLQHPLQRLPTQDCTGNSRCAMVCCQSQSSNVTLIVLEAKRRFIHSAGSHILDHSDDLVPFLNDVIERTYTESGYSWCGRLLERIVRRLPRNW